MEKAILNVSGMSCQHCVNAVTNAVSALTGMQSVSVDLSAGTVTVEYNEKAALEHIKAVIDDLGFEVL